MTIMNGASNGSVEDILASIRTSIAEESGPARFVAAEIQMPSHNVQVRREAHFAEEAPEFELPAIFKPGHHPSPERPKLLGRLSDALKTTQGEHARLRTVIPFDPSAAGRLAEPMAAPVQNNTRPQPQPHPAPTSAARESMNGPFPAAATQPNTPDVKREMPTFFDTRINKLGELTRQVYTPRAVEPEPQPVPQPQTYRQPPTLPENFSYHTNDAVDDAAAQLLRPMLRQWLHENMPKIVEKALLSEVQGELNGGKPTRRT